MLFADMRVGVPYIVTRESDDGSLVAGDQIALLPDGSLVNLQAEGWLDQEDLVHATPGMQCEVDRYRIQRRKEKSSMSGSESAAPSGAVMARPITDRVKAYHAWRDRLSADPTCWKFSDREDAIAYAAFIAGWWLRTGDNPDDHFNPPNVEADCGDGGPR